MDQRYDESVPVEDGPVIQERDEHVVLKDRVGGDLTVDDLVENALCRGLEITLCLDMAEIPLGTAPPETVLPGPPPGAEEALSGAMSPTAPASALTGGGRSLAPVHGSLGDALRAVRGARHGLCLRSDRLPPRLGRTAGGGMAGIGLRSLA